MESKLVLAEDDEYYFEEGNKQHQYEGMIFAGMVGSAALVMAMLLFNRALLDQWRFLAINLLFLAIVSLKSSAGHKFRLTNAPNCTSTSNSTNHDSTLCLKDNGECYNERIRVKRRAIVEGNREMSKEELNRRAEAFIAMFREQLLSDHTNTTSRK